LRHQLSRVQAAPAVETPNAAEASKYVERPSNRKPSRSKIEQSSAQPTKPVAEKTASAPKAENRQHKRYWTEAHIARELHRHGFAGKAENKNALGLNPRAFAARSARY
jgi:hypothetical protein